MFFIYICNDAAEKILVIAIDAANCGINNSQCLNAQCVIIAAILQIYPRSETMKRKIIVIIILSALAVMILLAVGYFKLVSNSIKATELTQVINWREYITYEMLSDKLQNIISEEEFYDISDSGRLNFYRKVEGLKVEERRKDDPSTDWWKTPQCADSVEAEGKHYYVEIGFDCRATVFGVKIINFYTHIYEYKSEI